MRFKERRPRRPLRQGLKMGCSESLCKEQSQITFFKSPLIRPPRTFTNRDLKTVFREFLDKGLEKGCPESLSKEQSQITLVKSPLSRSRSTLAIPETPPHILKMESPKWISRYSPDWQQPRFGATAKVNSQSPAIHWMAKTFSLNCLSCRIPCQNLHSLNVSPWFSEKALLFSDFYALSHPLPKLSSKLLGKSNGGFSEGGFSNNRFVLKPDVAIASEVSILNKNALAITDFRAKKAQHTWHLLAWLEWRCADAQTMHELLMTQVVGLAIMVPTPGLKTESVLDSVRFPESFRARA